VSDAPAAPPTEESEPRRGGPTPSAPGPPPPRPPEGFSRPETLFERIGYAASTWLGRAGIVVVILLVLFGLIIGIPMWRVAGSPSYRAAKQFLVDSPGVGEEIGEVTRIDTVPAWYRLGPDRAEFRRVEVQGDFMAGFANLTVTNQAGIWTVTSASFVSDKYARGVHRRKVLVDGSFKTH
jgi:hypothetical protein